MNIIKPYDGKDISLQPEVYAVSLHLLFHFKSN